MKKILTEEAIKEKHLIGIRTKSINWNESIVGFIVKVTDLDITINEIDKYGAMIGQTIINLDDILNIDVNDRYLKRLKFIYDNKSIFDYNNRITIWKNNNELFSYIKKLIKEEIITTFFLEDDEYVIGIPIEVNKEYIKIKCVGDEGDDDGISYYLINNLIGLRYNSIEEQRIKILYDNRHSFYI
jgi:hypothetical protein